MSSTKIISLLLSFLFISSLLFIPVSAADAEPPKEYKQVDGFFQWLARQGSGITEWLGLTTYSTELYCASSEDNRHYSTDYQYVHKGVLGNETGYYYCICNYCGQYFKAYEQDVKQSYDNYVAGLEESIVSNDGAIYWKFHDQIPKSEQYAEYSFTKEEKSLTSGNEQYFYYRDDYHYYLRGYFNNRSTLEFDKISLYQKNSFTFDIKETGLYKFHFVNIIRPSNWGAKVFIDINKSDGSDYRYFDAGESSFTKNNNVYVHDEIIPFDIGTYNVVIYTDREQFCYNRKINETFNSVWGPYYVVPVEYTINTPSNSESRIGNITGDYGITGDDGSIVKSEDNYIFNETNNNYHNPYTDNTKTVTNWSYDYSNREYNLTFDDGTTSTVKYGNDKITINENNTVYNVYYMGEKVIPDHEHNYIEEVITAPTCTLEGQSKFTCDICKASYTKDVAALGHKWTVKQSVQTQYGENGELLQQGYTIFRCSVCGEEYKSDSGAAPPGGSGGGSSGTGDGEQSGEDGGQSWLDKLGEFFGKTLGKLISLIGSVITGILDGLISLVDNVLSSLGGIVELFGNFGPAMGNLWSWLPPEIVAVMVAGVSIIVLVSVVKAFI